MTMPIHRVNASSNIFLECNETLPGYIENEKKDFETMLKEMQEIYKKGSYISTSMIQSKYHVESAVALRIMSEIIKHQD